MTHTAQKGIKTALVSLEMDSDEVEARFAGRLTGKNSRVYLRENFACQGLQVAPGAVELLSWWCHPSGIHWGRVEAEIREMVRVDGVRSVVIDYFTLIKKPDGKSNDASLWGEISKAIKRLAQELRICIVLLCQLNREGAEGEPFKWHLRETGQLEQDGNAICFLWREREDGPVFVKVSDNRSGPTVGKKETLFDGGTCTWSLVESYTAPKVNVQGW